MGFKSSKSEEEEERRKNEETGEEWAEMGRRCGKNGRWKLAQIEQMPRKWRGKGGEEDRECGRSTALKEVWKEWEEQGQPQQKIEGIGDC